MPYIPEHRREYLADSEDARPFESDTPGELNYVLTMAAICYVEQNGLTYQSLNDVVGALESCKAEFQRRVVVPYEKRKIKENGDCYPSMVRGK